MLDRDPQVKAETFWSATLPFMCEVACRMPQLFKDQGPLPFLLRDAAYTYERRKLVLSAEQCACLLAHMFFCTFPGRSHREHTGKNGYVPWPQAAAHGTSPCHGSRRAGRRHGGRSRR